MVNDADKQSVLQKIKEQQWASAIYREIKEKVTPYADRHVNDPEWILSRYLMNRIPGKRYTRHYADNAGQGLVRWEGDAPVPTVRVSTWLRSPVTEKGTAYREPSVEELTPYDTSRVMPLFNPETGKKENIDPQAFIADLNGKINGLALDAAIVYWLTGEEKFARFAADIADQWARGVYYQEPIYGPCRTGLLDIQTLGDASYRSLILAYDFVKSYMRQKGYDLHWYDTVFEKFASTLAYRGFWDNNWYAAESSTLVFAALSIENTQKRDYYLQYFLEKDTINGGCGQLALPTTVRKWLTRDGHWKEPGGYHNYPVGNLLLASLAMEKNGYDIFRRFPALFQASYAMLKYSFPNLTVSAFGDTGRASQDGGSLDIGLWGAVRYNSPQLAEMVASMQKMTEGKIYRRENSGYVGLLCFLPEIPVTKTVYEWNRTGTLDFARYFLQRNGMDREHGLMVGVQGATYNHNHCNGMAMELYGLGEVLGIDAGTGPNYEHPLHRNYFSQWAAHNTVAAAGSSSSVPFSGAAGTKNIGQIEMTAMEPLADQPAVSPDHSFTNTRYFDKSTNTRQTRTLAIIRTSGTTGYYVDIYRSDNPVCNDYIYHNIGDTVTFLDETGRPLAAMADQYPRTERDYPGFRFYTEVRKLETHTGNVIARFPFRTEKGNAFLDARIAGYNGFDFFSAFSPKTKTSGKFNSGKPVPLFTVHTNGEAKTRPFAVVFEPYREIGRPSVVRVEAPEKFCDGFHSVLKVTNRNGSVQQIFQSDSLLEIAAEEGQRFRGYFGVAGYDRGKLTCLYLGKGSLITAAGFSLETATPEGSAYLAGDGGQFLITCNQDTRVTIPGIKGISGIVLSSPEGTIRLNYIDRDGKVTINIPRVNNGTIRPERRSSGQSSLPSGKK